MSQVRSSLLQTLQTVHDFAPKACFRVSSGKTWMSSTHPKARNEFRGIVLAGSQVHVPMHKVEIGLLLRFNKKACTGPVSQRWEAGRDRVDRLLTKRWSVERKISTIQRVVFPQLFAGCQSVHISFGLGVVALTLIFNIQARIYENYGIEHGEINCEDSIKGWHPVAVRL